MEIRAVHHVGLSVSDIERASAWYRDVLGFEPGVRWEVGDGAVRIALVAAGGARIELFEARGGIAGPDEGAGVMESLSRRGWKHLALEVPDLDAAVAEARAAGAGVIAEPEESEGGFRYAFLADPDGHHVELVGPSAG